MKTQFRSLTVAALLTAANTNAGIYAYTSPFSLGGGTGSGLIPDANPTGWWDARTISDVPGAVGSLTVSLNISGGWNSDLYGCLVHVDTGNQTASAILLNRIGITGGTPFGNTGAGMSVTLSSDTATDYGNIRDAASGVITGTYNPDNALGSLVVFNGMTGNGTWKLFLADLSGGNQSTVVNWELDLGVTAVPEPVNVALGIFAGVFLLVIVAGSRPVRDRVQRWCAAMVQWIDAV
jgi:hypothetical protein